MPLPITHSGTYYRLPWDARICLADLVSAIDGARESIHCTLYSLTHPVLGDALSRAITNGIAVSLVLDYSQGGDKASVALVKTLCDTFTNRGIDPATRITYTTSPDRDLFCHIKAAVIDEQRVVEGSLNWTTTGFGQVQSCLIVEDPSLAASLIADHALLTTWAHENHPAWQIGGTACPLTVVPTAGTPAPAKPGSNPSPAAGNAAASSAKAS